MAKHHTGKIELPEHSGITMTFYYDYTIDEDDRVANFDWWITPEGNGQHPNYYLAKGDQAFTFKWPGKSGKLQVYTYDKPDTYTNSGGHTVYRGFCKVPSSLNSAYNGKEFFDTNGNYTGVRRWVKVFGSKWLKGSCKVYYDSDGEAKVYPKASFSWYPAKRLIFDRVIKLKSIPKIYTVKFNANGGSGAPDDQFKVHGKTLKLSSTKPTKSGFTFKGWGTSETDTNPNYQAGSNYTANAAITLYAIWGKTITYNSNSGTISGDTTQIKYSKTNLTLFAKSKASRTGYNLLGWTDTKLADTIKSYSKYTTIGTARFFPPSYSLNVNDVSTLYAYWQNKTNIPITLKDYYQNNTKISDKKILVTYAYTIESGSKSWFTSNKYSREGYKLLGWSKQKVNVYTDTPSQTELRSLLWDYNAKYTDNVNGITLYPVLQYSTTCYINDHGTWKLALPYVNVQGVWKQSIMYIKDIDKWKL